MNQGTGLLVILTLKGYLMKLGPVPLQEGRRLKPLPDMLLAFSGVSDLLLSDFIHYSQCFHSWVIK